MKREYYQIYIDSSQAVQGAGTPNLATYDLSTIIPNISTDRCYIRVSYFNVYIASSVWKTNQVGTLLIKTPSAFTRNSYQTVSPEGVRALVQNSSIIGIAPTGNDLSVSQNSIANTQYLEIGNIFNGMFTVEITNEVGGSLSSIMNSSAKGYVMILDVYFEQPCGCD